MREVGEIHQVCLKQYFSCPYCGHETSDYFFIYHQILDAIKAKSTRKVTQCEYCGRYFVAFCEVETSVTTLKIEGEDDGA